MSANEPLIINLPNDFGERCQRTNARIEAGEAMTMQYVADQLGIPFEFYAAAQAIAIALRNGQRVIIDPAPAPRGN
jgi:hypothetical protein